MSARRMSLAIAVAGVLAASLSACGEDEPDADTAAVGEQDPALTAALDEQIMVDPDLVGQNQANQVASLGPVDGMIPTVESGDKAVAAARAEALDLVGGAGAMRKAPEPREISGSLPPEASLTAAERAAVSPGGSRNCADRAQYTMQWAAKLPATFPVYPRGAVQEAAGTDEGGCALRVVNFVTPVPVREVMDFYFTRARAAGYSAQYVRQGGDDIIGGTKGKASYVAYARRMADGNTEVDLVVGGG